MVTATSTSKEEVVDMDVDALTTTPGAVLVDFDWTGKDGAWDGEANYSTDVVQSAVRPIRLGRWGV